jgi:hypothetical protein
MRIQISITCPLIELTGDRHVQGDILDRSLTQSHTLANFPQAYDIHTHGSAQGGGSHTAIPDQQV